MRKLLTTLLTLSTFIKPALSQETFPVNGIHDERHVYYAFTNAKLCVDYRTMIDSATLLIRDGLVVDAGRNLKIPDGAVVTDLKGKYIYPSFIDLVTDYGMPEIKKANPGEQRGPQFLSNTKGPYGWNQAIKPEVKAADLFNADEKKADEFRQAGFGAVLSQNRDGIARGTAVFVELSNQKPQQVIIREKAAACYSFDKGSSTQDYPGSLMGCIALLRQTYLDAAWYKSSGYKKETNLSLEAWNSNQALPQLFEVKDKYSLLRADKIADEAGVKYIIRGNGDEYERISEVKAAGVSLVVPVNFPEPYDVNDPYDAENISLGEMKHWEMAPANAAAVDKAGILFAFTSADMKSKKDFLKNVRKAIESGLSEESALKACTYNPASMIGMADKTGGLKSGMKANFLITSKKIFDKENVIHENWSNGKRYIIKNIAAKDVRGIYELTVGSLKLLPLKIGGTPEDPAVTVQEDSVKIKSSYSVTENAVLFSFELKKFAKGVVRLNGFYDADSRTFSGNGLLPDGSQVAWSAKYISAFVEEAKKDTAKKDSAAGRTGPLLFPNMAYGFRELPKAGTVLIRNVTVWTNEDAGIQANTDVLIRDGKIAKVGKGLDTKGMDGAETIDGTGLHLTPGIIDEHSHIAISGDVNECTQAVTAEVRIGDVVDGDDINIYRQLSGGVTCSHLLHGSCNPIGGQTQLIKLRWGLAPEQMKFAGWDGFIKFALGENVKQSNWGDFNVIRYPQTRMGVEQTYVDAFSRAKKYYEERNRFNALSYGDKEKSIAPRQDLELDALAEILNKKRFITCHSYQQGEINMLMHVADSFGFKVNTFTHILEGYKVADKMKKHGAGASSFADWWAYKFEVIEAIPHNGAILHDVGVITAFNSDDAEMARRLNQEAAKAVKYGAVTEEEALKFVTLNPAKLLHVDNRTGSIREGKDADLVLWTDNPLSVYAKVLRTYVDGICYYESGRDQQMRKDIASEKARIAAKMIAEKSRGGESQKPAMTIKELHHCIDHENAAAEESAY